MKTTTTPIDIYQNLAKTRTKQADAINAGLIEYGRRETTKICTRKRVAESEGGQKDVLLQVLQSRVPQLTGIGRPPERSPKGEIYVRTLHGGVQIITWGKAPLPRWRPHT